MNLLLKNLILFALALLVVESKYEIILDRQEMPLGDDDELFLTNYTARIRKYNRTAAVLSGCFQTFREVNENHTAEFEAFNLSGGQYKKLFGRNIGKVCELGRDESLKPEIMKFLKETNASWTWGECPIKAQTVCVENWRPDALGEYLPAYIPGNERWKLTVYLVENAKRVGGMTYFAILRDNQKLFDSKWKK